MEKLVFQIGEKKAGESTLSFMGRIRVYVVTEDNIQLDGHILLKDMISFYPKKGAIKISTIGLVSERFYDQRIALNVEHLPGKVKVFPIYYWDHITKKHSICQEAEIDYMDLIYYSPYILKTFQNSR